MVVQLHMFESQKYLSSFTRVFKDQFRDRNVVCLSLNKPFEVVKKRFVREGIDMSHMFFIDCVSRCVGADTPQIKDCLLLEDASSLTHMGVAVHAAIDHFFERENVVLVIDSLSTLLLHHDESELTKFCMTLVNKLNLVGIDAVFFVLSVDKDKDIVHRLSSLTDKVVVVEE